MKGLVRLPMVAGEIEKYVLDEHGSAQAAYSLCKLSASYAGNCLRVRRSSDNTEEDIGFSGKDIDTATLLSFVGAGDGYVTTWYDQSGQGVNLVQSTELKQPKIADTGVLTTLEGETMIYSFDQGFVRASNAVQLDDFSVYAKCGMLGGLGGNITQNSFVGTTNTGIQLIYTTSVLISFRDIATDRRIAGANSGYLQCAFTRKDNVGRYYQCGFRSYNSGLTGSNDVLEKTDITVSSQLRLETNRQVFSDWGGSNGWRGHMHTIIIYPAQHDDATVKAINELLP